RRRVHAARDGRDEALGDARAHARAGERLERAQVREAARQHAVEARAHGTAEADGAAHVARPRVRGDAEHARARQGVGAARGVAPGARARWLDDVETELAHQRADGRPAHGERLRAEVHTDAVETGQVATADGTAGDVRGLEHDDAQAARTQRPGRGETGHSRADDDRVGALDPLAGRGGGLRGAGRRRLGAHRPVASSVASSRSEASPESAWTSPTTRVRTSGSVSGGTPWPRLTTCPGAVRPRRTTSRT